MPSALVVAKWLRMLASPSHSVSMDLIMTIRYIGTFRVYGVTVNATVLSSIWKLRRLNVPVGVSAEMGSFGCRRTLYKTHQAKTHRENPLRSCSYPFLLLLGLKYPRYIAFTGSDIPGQRCRVLCTVPGEYHP